MMIVNHMTFESKRFLEALDTCEEGDKVLLCLPEQGNVWYGFIEKSTITIIRLINHVLIYRMVGEFCPLFKALGKEEVRK